MTMRRVKLKKGARTEGLNRGIDLGFFTDPNQDVRGRDPETGKEIDLDKGGVEIMVNNREYHRLELFGLIEPEDTRLVAPAADQPEVDEAHLAAQRDLMEANAETRRGMSGRNDDVDMTYDADTRAARGPVHDERGPSGTNRGVHPGGVGHDPKDGFSNKDQVQREIRATQAQGAGQVQRVEDRTVEADDKDAGDGRSKTKAGDKDSAKASDRSTPRGDDKSSGQTKAGDKQGK